MQTVNCCDNVQSVFCSWLTNNKNEKPFSIFSIYSEAYASEYLENIEEMFQWYTQWLLEMSNMNDACTKFRF